MRKARCKGIDAKNFIAEGFTPEKKMRFVEIRLAAFHQAQVIAGLVHVQRHIGVARRIFIHQRKKERAGINEKGEKKNPIFKTVVLR